MTKASLLLISLMEVDWEDTRFAVPGASEVLHRNLEASFGRSGILSPPILWAGPNNRLVIVDGFKRLSWLYRQGFRAAECFVYPAEVRKGELTLAKVETMLFGPTLNGAEKAAIVSMLSEVVSEDELLLTYLPALDIPGRRDTCARWLRLAASGPELVDALAADAIHERAALELAEWCKEARGAAVLLLVGLKCSASIQMEILERIAEIAVRDGCAPEELLGRREIQAVLNDSRMHHREKTHAMRELLEQKRFPRLKAREAQVHRTLKEIPLPKAARLVPPPAFEGDRWRLQLDFSNARELCETLQEMECVAASNSLDTLITGSSAAGAGVDAVCSSGRVGKKDG